MENLEKYSKTELLKIGNDYKSEHGKLRNEVINSIDEISRLDVEINNKLIQLDLIEKNYVEVVAKLSE